MVNGLPPGVGMWLGAVVASPLLEVIMYTTIFLPKRNLKILTLTVRNAVVLAALLTAAYVALPFLSFPALSSASKAKTIFPAASNWTGSPLSSPSASVGSPSSSSSGPSADLLNK